MALTGYGYAERNADSYVDWREVGQYTTDMIDETIKVRQEKKDALDQATRDALKFVANSPIGADASARRSALEMADTVSKNLLIQEKLMKSGRIDPKDYLIYNQNALDTIDLAFNANKAYQENYQKIMDGVAKKDMSGLTILNAAKAEQYGDWNKNGWIMSPEGNLMVGVKTEEEIDGKKVQKLDKITSVSAVNGLLLNTIPHNRLEDQVTNWVGTLGKNQIVTRTIATLTRQGVVLTEENITKRVDIDPATKKAMFVFLNAEKQKITSLLGSDTNMASILYDTKKTTDDGVPYTPTDSAEEARKDPSKILQIYNEENGGYNFVISDKQKKELENFTLNRMREQYDIVQKVDVGSQIQDQSTEWQYKAGKENEKEREFAKNLAQNIVFSMTGNQNESSAGTKYLGGKTGLQINKLTNGYEVITKEGKQFYSFDQNGQLADPFSFSKSLIGVIKRSLPDEYKNVSEDIILNYVKEFLPKEASINKTTTATSFEPKPVKQTAVQQFSSYIDRSMSQKFNKGATSDQIVASLNEKLEGTGFKADKTFINGYIYIKGKKGAESPAFKAEDINKGLGRLSKWMKENLPSKTIGGVEDKEAAAQELIEAGAIKSASKPIQFDAEGNIIQ